VAPLTALFSAMLLFFLVKKWKFAGNSAGNFHKNAGNLAFTVQPFRPYNCGLSLGLEE